MAASAPASAETLAERAAALAPHATLALPDAEIWGEGPFPVAIMLHGCGGRRPFLDNYARAANAAGAAALIVDSFAHRGIGRMKALSAVCTGALLRGRERAGDLYAMADWARRQSWADPERIVAAGWSHGGWTVMDALALRSGDEMARATGIADLPQEPLAGVSGAFLVYPYVGPPAIGGRRAWRLSPRTLAIVGGRDTVSGSRGPTAALERHRARGVEIETVLFARATHAFDEQGTISPIFSYDADYAQRAEALLADFIRAPPPR